MTIAMAAVAALNAPAVGFASTNLGGPQLAAGSASICLEANGFGAMLAYGALHSKVEAWTALPQNWDGDDGVAPETRTANAACDFLARLQAAGLPVPTPYIAGDGEIGFRWRNNGRLASIAFLSDGHIVGKVPHTDKPFRIDEPYSEYADLNGLLKSLAGFVA